MSVENVPAEAMLSWARMKPVVVELRSVRRHTLSVLPVVTLEAQATAGAAVHAATDTNGTPRLTNTLQLRASS